MTSSENIALGITSKVTPPPPHMPNPQKPADSVGLDRHGVDLLVSTDPSGNNASTYCS